MAKKKKKEEEIEELEFEEEEDDLDLEDLEEEEDDDEDDDEEEIVDEEEEDDEEAEEEEDDEEETEEEDDEEETEEEDDEEEAEEEEDEEEEEEEEEDEEEETEEEDDEEEEVELPKEKARFPGKKIKPKKKRAGSGGGARVNRLVIDGQDTVVPIAFKPFLKGLAKFGKVLHKKSITAVTLGKDGPNFCSIAREAKEGTIYLWLNRSVIDDENYFQPKSKADKKLCDFWTKPYKAVKVSVAKDNIDGGLGIVEEYAEWFSKNVVGSKKKEEVKEEPKKETKKKKSKKAEKKVEKKKEGKKKTSKKKGKGKKKK